jgi:hypothetical protein
MEKQNKFDVNFKKLLSDDKEINKILDRIDGEYLVVDVFLSTYEKNGNRHGVILTATNLETGQPQKIIIDAIYGEPNSTQVKELTYGNGADCDKRIILYTLGHPDHKEREYEYDGEMAEGFATINNDCGLDTYIFKIPNCIIGADPVPLKFNAEVFADGKRRTLYKKLPSLQEFEQAEFRVIYHYTIDWDYEYIERLDDWYNGTWRLVINDIDFKYPVWNEDGLFMHGVSKSDIGVVNLQWFKVNRIGLIGTFFDNREIVTEKQASGNSIISIKLWDKPFSYFTNASIEEKVRIAESIRGYDGVIFEFWQEVFDRKNSDDEIIKLLGCIPEKAFADLDQEISA